MTKLKTGRHTSSIYESKKSKKRNKLNSILKKKIKKAIKAIKKSVENKDIKTAVEQLPIAFSKLDKAAKKHVIHNNTSSRQKAKLSKLISKIKSIQKK
ncbi:MAG: 30S ribosomal protein S20 [Endomicrobium sp.]|jgi:small subunit ribosomal protein S20|nr:30S ribosomal protein S20 [Endomicrobium sp.]